MSSFNIPPGVTLITIKSTVVERANANTACFRWKIPKFSDTERLSNLRVLGPSIQAIDSKIEWRLMLYPNGRGRRTEDDFIALAVYYCSEIDNVLACFELSFVNIDNKVIESFMFKKHVNLTIYSKSSSTRLMTYAGHVQLNVKRSDIEDPKNRILKDNCLTISFDVTYFDPIIDKTSISSMNEEKNLIKERLKEFDDFGKLLEDDRFSDVKFVVGNKEIHGHKAIIASKSPVFDAMFQHDMQEKKTNVVNIVDIDYTVLMELFRFMYTGKVRDIEKVACDLIVAAEKYGVESLKSLCEKALLKDLKIDNVVRYFMIADAYNVICLRKRALDFMVEHVQQIPDCDFECLGSDLGLEILQAKVEKLYVEIPKLRSSIEQNLSQLPSSRIIT